MAQLGGQDEDVCVEDLFPDGRPFVAAAHIDLHAAFDLVLRDSQSGSADVVFFKFVQDVPGHEFAA